MILFVCALVGCVYIAMCMHSNVLAMHSYMLVYITMCIADGRFVGMFWVGVSIAIYLVFAHYVLYVCVNA